VVGLTGAGGRRRAQEHSRVRTAALFATALFGLFVASLITASPVSARGGVACDQYECMEEDPGSDELASPRGFGSEIEEALAIDTPATGDSGASHGGELGSAEPVTSTGYYNNGESGREQEAIARHPAHEPASVIEKVKDAGPAHPTDERTGGPIRSPRGEACEESSCSLKAGEGRTSPSGEFDYFEPPAEPYSRAGWEGHIRDQCFFDERGMWVEPPEGKLDTHCGLKDLPDAWECEVYYDTVHGTVRGCREGSASHSMERPCSGPIHLYDKAGREIGTVPSCPRIRTEACDESQCGAPVPSDWTCRREYWNFGRLYGDEIRTIRRCASPEFYEYINGERPPCNRKNGKYIAAIYDERGRRVDGMTCLPGGTGGDLGEWAGLEAEKADDALNHTKRRATTGSPSTRTTPPDSDGLSERSDAPSAQPIPVMGEVAGDKRLWDLAPTASSIEGVTGGVVPWSAEVAPGYDRFDSKSASGANETDEYSTVVQPALQSWAREENQFKERLESRDEALPAAPAMGVFAARDLTGAGDAPASEGSRSCVPGKRDVPWRLERNNDTGGPCESTNPAAGLTGTRPDGGERAGSGTSSHPAASTGGTGGWLERLLPLAGLAAVGGIFTLRRRFFV
jgi:hypothetical protein